MDDETIAKYREAGRIAGRARDIARSLVGEGAGMLDVVNEAETFILENGGGLAFPVNLSIDNEAAHFTPRSTDGSAVFRKGQLVKIDVGAHVDGFIADTATTVEVGSNVWTHLIRASEKALEAAIETIGEAPLSTIGRSIQDTIQGFGYEPVENLTGHSLDRYELHAGISVPNVERAIAGNVPLGTAIAIEPFASTGTAKVSGKVLGNIYIFKKEVRLKSPDAVQLQRFLMGRPALPFSERACSRVSANVQRSLAILMRRRGIYGYPVLADEPGSMVSQAEHTVLVLDGERIVTTR